MELTFNNKTLADILKAHPEYKRILLKFYHGLGDAIAFYVNCLPRLEMEFPKREFSIELQPGQEVISDCVVINPDENDYDLSVFIMFPCAEWEPGLETKAEKCGRVELGIIIPEDDPEYYNLEFFEDLTSPFVGVHFVSTSNDGLCCPEPCARLIWEKIEKSGLIPIDTHFRHEIATIDRKIFAWERRNVQNVRPTVEKLFGMMKHLGGFAGVASGNFWTALCCLEPEKILFINTEFPVRKLTHIPIRQIKAKDPDEDVIDAWLYEITKGAGHV